MEKKNVISSSYSPNYLELVACNLCGQDNFEVLYNAPIHLSDLESLGDYVASTDRFDHYGQIVRCRACGLVYTNPRPAGRRIFQGYSKAVDVDYASEDSSRSINAHMSLQTIKKFVQRGELLDVGCSTGYFLNAARLYFETSGIELSHWAVTFAREKLKLNVKEGIIEEASFPEDHFDVVTMNDVIEHLTDPMATLRKIHSITKPGGLLYIVTPNISSLTAKILRRKWWGLRPAHLYYFSKDTLTASLEKVGFEVVLPKSYGRIFTYGYWVSRLENYPRIISRISEGIVDALEIRDKFLYLDTRDSMEVCARKK